MESTLGWGFLHHTHAVVLLESGSESIFFPLLFWFGARRENWVQCMRVIPRGATLVVLLHRRGRIAASSPTTFRRGRNPVIGLKDRVAIGVIVDLHGIGDCRYDYTNHVHAGTFPA